VFKVGNQALNARTQFWNDTQRQVEGQLDHADPTSVAVPAQVRHSQRLTRQSNGFLIVWRAGNRLGSSQILRSNEVLGLPIGDVQKREYSRSIPVPGANSGKIAGRSPSEISTIFAAGASKSGRCLCLQGIHSRSAWICN